jgi:hypothetical protein
MFAIVVYCCDHHFVESGDYFPACSQETFVYEREFRHVLGLNLSIDGDRKHIQLPISIDCVQED